MSTRPASQEQLDLLAAKLELQASELAALRARVAALESQLAGTAQGSEFEVVSAGPPSQKAGGPKVLSSSGISEEPREMVRGIGHWLKRCLTGEI